MTSHRGKRLAVFGVLGSVIAVGLVPPAHGASQPQPAPDEHGFLLLDEQPPRVLVMAGEPHKSTLPAPNLQAPSNSGDLTASAIVPGATFTVNYLGFTSEAEAAFQSAVDVLSTLISSPVDIEVDAVWEALEPGVLGSAGATQYISFPDGPARPERTFYPSALANAALGRDVDEVDMGNPKSEVQASFSSAFSNWYFGTDGNTPTGMYDFKSVVLHELVHGIGFVGSASYSGGSGSWGLSTSVGTFPIAYDLTVENTAGQSVLDTSLFPNPSTALGSQLTGNALLFTGPLAARGAAGSATPKLHAPAAWNGGSSFSHLDEATYPAGDVNSLMTPSIGAGEAIHSPGPIALGMMADTGWDARMVPAAPTGVSAVAGLGSAEVGWTAPTDDGGAGVQSYLVTPSGGAAVQVAAPATSTTISGLPLDVPVTFTVQAVNGIGAGPSSAPSASVVPDGSAPPAAPRVADFDGNGHSDLAVFRPSSGQWFVKGQSAFTYGQAGDIPVAADYDGDGDTDGAVFRPATGRWYVKGASSFGFGTAGDIPVPGNFVGDARTEPAVFRPSTGRWYVKGGSSFPFGTAGDIPVPADYDGDGLADAAVFRPSTGHWYIRGMSSFPFGTRGDIPVSADYDGDGTAEPAVFRPSAGTWYVRGSSSVPYGRAGDIPVPADYDGNGSTEQAVYRPSAGQWYLRGTGSFSYGVASDIPLPAPPALLADLATPEL